MNIVVGILSWVLLCVSIGYCAVTVVDFVKRIVAGIKARSRDDKKIDESEVDTSK